jgi:hypothetical protein
MARRDVDEVSHDIDMCALSRDVEVTVTECAGTASSGWCLMPAHLQDFQIPCFDGPVGVVFLCDAACVLAEEGEVPA